MKKAMVIHKNWETGDCLYSVYNSDDVGNWIDSFKTKEEAIMFCEDNLYCDVIDYIEDKEPK